MDKAIKIYKLKREHWELRQFSSCFDKVNFIVDRHRKLNDDFENIGITIPHRYYKRLHFHFYSFNSYPGDSPWKSFFPEFIQQYHSFEIQSFCFVLFIHNLDEIFVVIGGRGIYAVKRYIDNNFGLDIVGRTINPSQDIIHLAQIRGITGNVAGRTNTYREDQKILDIDSFGKVFKKLMFEVNPKSLKDDFNLDLSTIGSRKITALAEDGFKLNIGRNFDGLCDLILRYTEILQRPLSVNIGTFSPITDQKEIDKAITIKLFLIIQERLIKKGIGKRVFFDYDFCHPSKMIDFYECDFYEVVFKPKNEVIVSTFNRNEVFELFLNYTEENIDYNSLRTLMSFTGRCQVLGIKNGNIQTRAPIITHLSCEIGYDDASVYKIDEQWYSVRGQFIQDLNEQCRYYFEAFKAPDILPEVWHNPNIKPFDEDWYNRKYLSYDGFIVLDKVLSQNIELCDLLFETEDEIFCIHVKKGFNGMMRGLTNQVRISARRLWIDIQSEDKPFLEGIYNSLISKENWTYCGSPTWDEFVNKFKKKITYVIAFTSMTTKQKRVFTHVESFQSNIAKYSLVETMKLMRLQDFDVRILEIEHEYIDILE